MVHYITGLWSSVKFNALQQARGNYSSNMRLSPQAREELVWWIDNIATASKPAQCPNPDLVLQSDAFHMGWGLEVTLLQGTDGLPGNKRSISMS